MDIPNQARKVLNECLERWMKSEEEAPKLSKADFESVFKEGNGLTLEKFTRLVGLYLVQREFASGQFTMSWSVYGFHVSSLGAAWAKESWLDRNRDAYLVFLGVVLTLATTIATNLFWPNELTLSPQSIEAIKQSMTSSAE